MADHRLGCAKHQASIVRGSGSQGAEHRSPRLGCEIEKHVAAQDDAEDTGMRDPLPQAIDLKGHGSAQLRRNPPLLLLVFLEPPHHLENRQTALHFELRTDTLPGTLDRGAGDIGAEDIYFPALP